jgi:hypothetical protein
MTPEREAQMREMYIKEFGERPNSAGSYREQDDADEWDVRLSGFLACARALEPMAMDGERLDWMLDKNAFMVWTKRDGSILQCQVYTQDEDEEYHVLSGEHRYFNTPREAIDAAMSAALEDGNADV